VPTHSTLSWSALPERTFRIDLLVTRIITTNQRKAPTPPRTLSPTNQSSILSSLIPEVMDAKPIFALALRCSTAGAAGDRTASSGPVTGARVSSFETAWRADRSQA